GCQLLCGVAASDLPEPDEKGAAGASRSGGAGSESGGGSGGGDDGAAGGGNELECDEDPACKLCCAARVTDPQFIVAVQNYFDTCLCEPARQNAGSGSGECANAVPGCEGCCDRLCNGGAVAPADLAECDTCAARQGEGIDECDDPRSFCQANYGDIVCSEYFDCLVESHCRDGE
ncbi:MAG TPA: hypothetical protein VFS00_32475, partial [Polyangiaceae bacterium]|nr:hypothetical protein [Polyangiaceae bacterium]